MRSFTFWEQIPLEQLVSSPLLLLFSQAKCGWENFANPILLFRNSTEYKDNLLIPSQISQHLERGMGGCARYLHYEGPLCDMKTELIPFPPDVMQ